LKEQHEDPEVVREQLTALRQCEARLGEQILELTQQIREHELQAVDQDRDQENLNSQLSERCQRVAELDQQLSDRT